MLEHRLVGLRTVVVVGCTVVVVGCTVEVEGIARVDIELRVGIALVQDLYCLDIGIAHIESVVHHMHLVR